MVNNTISESIPESEYQDCVQELTAKLADERKLNSTKNVRTIELEEQAGRQVDFIMAFEKWLEVIQVAGDVQYFGVEKYHNYAQRRMVMSKWNELKTEHLNGTETEAD
jgi:hypothetical protein